MFFNYQNIETMLTEKNRKKYIIADFLVGRGFIISPVIMVLVFSLVNYFLGDPLLPFIYYAYMFLVVFTVGIAVSVIMFSVEKKILQEFKNQSQEKKFSKLKIILFLNESFYIFGFVIAIQTYNTFKRMYTEGTNMFIIIFSSLIMILFSVIIGFIVYKSNFKKLKAEIERKGLFEKLTIDN
ncbi:MAG: hypothetical protein V1779_17230 [bacterium]